MLSSSGKFPEDQDLFLAKCNACLFTKLKTSLDHGNGNEVIFLQYFS